MKRNLRTAGITATIELKDGSLISLDAELPQTKKKATNFVRGIMKRGIWVNCSKRLFGTEEYILPENIANIAMTYEPITIPARSERPIPLGDEG